MAAPITTPPLRLLSAAFICHLIGAFSLAHAQVDAGAPQRGLEQQLSLLIPFGKIPEFKSCAVKLAKGGQAESAIG